MVGGEEPPVIDAGGEYFGGCGCAGGDGGEGIERYVVTHKG